MGITCLSYTGSQARVWYTQKPDPLFLGVVQTGSEGLRQAVRHARTGLRRITVLSGGVGGARFLQGLLHGIRAGVCRGWRRTPQVTVVANTGDDWWVHGLKICPDLDTVMYTLGDGIDHERGWGRRDETWHAKDELATYGVEPTWFGLGDRDLATHLVRTQMLDAGYPLSQVTEALCRRWLAPTYGDRVRLLPMTDDRIETHVAIPDPESAQRATRRALPGVLGQAARRGAGRGAGLRRPRGVLPRARRHRRDHRRRPGRRPAEQPGRLGRHHPRRAPRPRGPGGHARPASSASPPSSAATTCAGWPSSCSPRSGSRSSAAGVGLHYGARSEGGVLDGWLVDEADAGDVPRVVEAGLACRAVPLLMTDLDATAAMAAAAVELVS